MQLRGYGITFYNTSRFKYVKSRSGNDAAVSGTPLARRVPCEYGADRGRSV